MNQVNSNILDFNIAAGNIPEWAEDIPEENYVEFYELQDKMGRNRALKYLADNGYLYVIPDNETGAVFYARLPKVDE